jgi:hypothetical protein
LSPFAGTKPGNGEYARGRIALSGGCLRSLGPVGG